MSETTMAVLAFTGGCALYLVVNRYVGEPLSRVGMRWLRNRGVR